MSEYDTHPEWEKENSLTSPSDRDRVNRWRPDQGSPELSNTEIEAAMTELNNTDFTNKFPRVDRTYADPPVPLQTFGLVSFVPAKGATPNANGVFGFAKLRGNYASELEASQKAHDLIKLDSYHQIYHTYVGRPFPITFSSKYSAETEEVDIRRETTKAVSQNIKEKKQEEQKIVAEIKQREENLLEESKKDEEDPYDTYITLRVKIAQLQWTYLEHQKKMAEIKDIILKTRVTLTELDTENPEFKDTYYEKYLKARRDAGIKETEEESQNNFMKFLVEDATLDFDQTQLVKEQGLEEQGLEEQVLEEQGLEETKGNETDV